MSYGTAPLDQLDPAYLHLAPAVLVPSVAVIDAAIARDPDLKLLGPYGAGDVGVENIRCRKTVYVTAPDVGLLLGSDLTPVEAWQRLRGAIVDAAAEDSCRPIVDWLRAALVRSGPNALSALRVPEPSAPLLDAILLQQRHRLLLSHLPGLDPSINCAAGTRIVETVGDVAVELRETRLEDKRICKRKERKVAAEYFGANLMHLLNLVQVTNVQDLPSSGRPWRGPPNTNSFWCYSGPSTERPKRWASAPPQSQRRPC